MSHSSNLAMLVVFIFNFSAGSFIDFIYMPLGAGFLLALLVVLQYVRFNLISTILVLIAFAYNLLLILQSICSVEVSRSFIPLFFLSLFTVGIYNLTRNLPLEAEPSDEKWIDIVLTWSLVANFMGIAFERIVLNDIRPSGYFFGEPSHLAFFLVPMVFFFFLRGQYIQLSLAFLTLSLSFSTSAIGVLFPLVLFIVSILFLKVLLQRKVSKLQIATLVTSFLFVIISISNNGVFERLHGVFYSFDLAGDANLSSLVFVNGWLAASIYIKETGFLGLGFDLMGCNGGVPTILSPYIIKISGVYLNYNDGSFIASKLLSEVGALGLVLLLIFLKTFVEMLYSLSQSLLHERKIPCYHALALAIYIPSFLFLFIRGTNYFSIPVLTLILGYFLWRNLKPLQNQLSES